MQPLGLQRIQSVKLSAKFAAQWQRDDQDEPILWLHPKRSAILAWTHATFACRWKQEFNAGL
jgi:hypothetical protein